MTTTQARSEGFVDVGPGRVWYESVGEGPAIMLLHGGPGGSSDYLVPLMDLADEGYRVVRYDQLGSRRSDKPLDTSLWEAGRFADEVDIVREALGLGKIRFIGQSWGAFLGVEYALRYQQNLAALVLYSGAASTVQCVEGMNSLRRLLPEATQAILTTYEELSDTDSPIYLEVVEELYRRHLCRLNPYPQHLQESMAHTALPVYNTMWGPNEFTCTGNLLDWDRRERLHEIDVPTLIVCGRYDEVIPACSITMHEGIAGSQLNIFEESSHLAHFEQPVEFLKVLREFLSGVETQ